MTRLRVALVHPFSWPEVRRGGERLFHDLGSYLAQAGHDVEMITGAWSGPSVERTADGVTVRRVQLRELAPLRRAHLGPPETFGVLALAPLLRRRYDIVHALTPSGVLAARATGHRCVYTVLGIPAEDDFALQPGSLTLFRAAVRSAPVTTALTRAAAQRVERIAGRPARVVAAGVRLDRFTPDLSPRTGPVRVLFASDASEIRKGVNHAMAAIVRLRRKHPDARLVLCGPGDPSWALSGVGCTASEVLARADPLAVLGLGVDARPAMEAVDKLAGVHPEQMPDVYRSGTVTVLPSWREAFGLVLAESLACGTPVACYAEEGMLEVVDSPDVGRTARPGDPDDLARALDEAVGLARLPSTAGACAEHARRWGWAESVGPAYEAAYEAALAGRSR